MGMIEYRTVESYMEASEAFNDSGRPYLAVVNLFGAFERAKGSEDIDEFTSHAVTIWNSASGIEERQVQAGKKSIEDIVMRLKVDIERVCRERQAEVVFSW
jgi:hypothetical protein